MRNFLDSCGIITRHLIRRVYGMSANSVRPANQPAPTLAEGAEFATVKIINARLVDTSFARTHANYSYPAWDATVTYVIGDKVTRQSVSYSCTAAVTGGAGPGTDTAHWAVTAGSTMVQESVEGCYTFTASVQFFRHSEPTRDAAGLSAFGMGAFDRAARLESRLALSSSLELMDSLGLYLTDVSPPTNVAALINGAVWDDRGAVDLTFIVSNVETELIESIASAEIDLWFQGQSGIDHKTIEVHS